MNKLTSFCDRVIEACWLAGLVIAPLFINLNSTVPFELNKSTAVRSIALVMLAAFIIKRVSLPELKSLLRQPLVILTLLLGLSYLASTFLSVLPSGSWWGNDVRGQGAYTLMGYFIIFAITTLTLNNWKQLERIFVAIILTSIPVMLYGFAQKGKLEALDWGADFSIRIASTLGNPIFLGSYLLMVIPLTVYLLIRALKESAPAKSVFYIIILLAQVVCLFLTESRGPLLGLITAGFFFIVLSGLVFRRRYLSLGSYIAAALVLGFFLALALPNTPFQALKSKMGRLGQLLEAREGAATVRLLIWQGVVKMVQSDSYRAVVGYGPETMFVPYYKYCPAELVTSEKNRITLPDRSHNEFFDTVITNGLIGALIYLLLFGAIIFYAFKSLGLIGNKDPGAVIPAKAGIQNTPEHMDSRLRGNDIVKEKALGKNRTHKTSIELVVFICLLLLFGLAGLVVPILLDKTIFIAVGVPLGIVAGAVVYLFYRTIAELKALDASCSTLYALRPTLLLITLFSALIGHFIETQFGIDLTASRTYFYIYLAILIVIMFKGLTNEQPEEPKKKGSDPIPATSMPYALSSMLIVTLILTTLVFNFVSAPSPHDNAEKAMRIAVLIIAAWLSSTVLFYLLNRKFTQPQPKNNRGSVATAPAGAGFILSSLISAVITVIYYIILVSFLPPFYSPTAAITIFYSGLFINILALAWALTRQEAGNKPGIATSPKSEIRNPKSLLAVSPLRVFSSILIAVITLFIITYTNLNLIKGDLIYKVGSGQEGAKNWSGALKLYEEALALSPKKNTYFGESARMCLEKYYAEPDPAKKKAWYDRCLDYLDKSVKYNPIDPTRQANMGRFYRVQGRESKDPARRAEQFNLAIKYYEQACELSPQHPALRNEVGEVYHEMGRYDEAIKQYERSLVIAPELSETYSHIGDAWLEKSTKPSGTGVDRDNAIKNYYQAVKIQAQVMPDLREQNQEVMFERTNSMVLKNYPQDYRAYYNLGRYYAGKGKRAPAIEMLAKALPLADEAVKPAIKELLERLKTGK
ncbi:MAG: O-antigen ligase family protein [Planctomycetes bacterium]|nr:O-antigen ligase family protein [Planctomycetota bacterium]